MLRLSPAKQETVTPANVAPMLEAHIEAYLDRIEAAMTALPPEERAERRRELRQHLDTTRAALEELGDTPEIALAEALHRLGDPGALARRFNRAWTQTTKGVESPWPAMRLGLRWFGIPFAAFLAGSLLATLCGHPLWDETQWWFVGLVSTPCLLGITFGVQRPQRAGMGAFYAMVILTLCSFPLIVFAPSSLALPLAIPAVAVFAFWIPLGCLAATATSFAVRAYQAQRRFRTS